MSSTQDQPDYYDILGVQRSATDVNIKKAYRKLAMKWHPDKNKNDPKEASKTFQSIGEAYDVLSDKRNRAIYDQYGYEGLRDGAIFESFFGTANPFVDFGFGDAMPFASRLRKQGPRKPDPVVKDLPCTLEELYNGCTKVFKITRKRFSPQGELRQASTELNVTVKPGWKKGTKVTFAGEGDEGPGIVPADVTLVITERPHQYFSREGNNLVYTSLLSLADALTNCIIEVPTLDGRTLRLPCPEVVSPGYERRLGGEGMPLNKTPGSRGDLLIRFRLVFPAFLPHSSKDKLGLLVAWSAHRHRVSSRSSLVDSETRVSRASPSHALSIRDYDEKNVNLRQVTLRRLLCPEIHMNQEDDGEAAQAEAREVASGGEGTQSRDDRPVTEPPKSGVDDAVAEAPRPPAGEGRE